MVRSTQEPPVEDQGGLERLGFKFLDLIGDEYRLQISINC